MSPPWKDEEDKVHGPAAPLSYKSTYGLPPGIPIPTVPEFGESSTEEFPESAPETFSESRERLADPASGGSAPTDPGQEQQAAAAATEPEEETPPPTDAGTAVPDLPTLRGFTDQTFVLMHMTNLINSRDEKLDPALIEELEKNTEDKEAAKSSISTIKALKAPLPYAYLPMDDGINTASRNATIQCYGEPHAFLNYLTMWPGYQKYLDASTEEISQLATKIHLFKVFHEGTREEAVEIVFPTSGISGQELEELLKNGSKRGYGAGIKSFDFTLDGTNPVMRTRSVSATLVIYADSMETLLKPRRGGYGNIDAEHLHYRYTDLAMHTDTVPGQMGGVDTDGSFGALDDLDYKIIVEVGLTKGSSLGSKLSGYTSLSLALGRVSHSYDIGQDGSITLSIDYKGHIEKEFANPLAYDVFATQESQTHDLYRQMGSYGLAQLCGAAATKEFNEKILSEGNAHLKMRVSSLMSEFRKKGGVYYIKIEDKVMRAWNVALNRYEDEIKDITTDAKGNKKKEISAQGQKNMEKAYETLQKALGALTKQEDEPIAGSTMATMTNSNSSLLGDPSGDDKQTGEIEKAAEDESEEEKINIRRCAIDPNNTQVAYFYAGDLINLILERLSAIYSEHGIEQIVENAEKKVGEDPALQQVHNATGATRSRALLHEARAMVAYEELVPTGGIYDMLGIGEQIAAIDPDLDAATAALEAARAAAAAAMGPYKEAGRGFRDIARKYRARGDRFKKFRVVLGPTMFTDFFSSQEIMCSIGDIPVALNHFNAWLADEVEGEDKYRMGLADFLNKFINHYLRSFLLGDKKLDQGILSQKKSFSSTSVAAYNPRSTKGVDALTAHRTNIPSRRGLLYEKISEAKRPILDTTGNIQRPGTIKESYDYMIFFEKQVAPAYPKGTTAPALAPYGISMFQHGRDRGILKTAQYQATNIKGRKEARHQAGNFNGLEQLTEVFDVTLHCYANLQVLNGHRIYLDAKSLVPYLSKETLESLHGYQLEDFGIGGFYVVNNVQHSFAQGKFDTIIRAQWEMWQKDKPKKKHSKSMEEAILSIQEPIREACKAAYEPETSVLGDLWDEAVAFAESIFGEGFTDKMTGLVKGLSDVFDGEEGEDHIYPSQDPSDYGPGSPFDGPQGTE